MQGWVGAYEWHFKVNTDFFEVTERANASCNNSLYCTLVFLPEEQFECEVFGFHQWFLSSMLLHWLQQDCGIERTGHPSNYKQMF